MCFLPRRINLIFVSWNRFVIYLFIYLLAVLRLPSCVRAFSSCVVRGLLLLAVCGLLIVVASLVAEHRLWGMWASVVGACGLQ